MDKYLKDTPVTSCRSLNIQTYVKRDLQHFHFHFDLLFSQNHSHVSLLQSVIPLDESSGLIEWVQNFEPLLKVVQDSYREQGLSIYPPKVEKYSTGGLHTNWTNLLLERPFHRHMQSPQLQQIPMPGRWRCLKIFWPFSLQSCRIGLQNSSITAEAGESLFFFFYH